MPPLPLNATIFTILLSILLVWKSVMVGFARGKYNTPAPLMHGDENFLKYFRAHYNTLERMLIFVPLLWIAALYGNDFYAGIAGYLWLLSRLIYALGYYKDKESRRLGLMIGLLPELFILIYVIYLVIIQLT